MRKTNRKVETKRNHSGRGESGQVSLIVVLTLLVLGAVILTPILLFMGSGLKQGESHEERTQGLYAADAGIEHAALQLRLYNGTFTSGSLVANGMNVTVVKEAGPKVDGRGRLYTVRSIAMQDEDTKGGILAQIKLTDSYAFIFDNAITSRLDVWLKPDSYVEGDVLYGGELDGSEWINGTARKQVIEGWPTADETAAFYWKDVATLNATSGSITITGNASNPTLIGPLWTNGNLDIDGNKNTYAKLNGTIYVKGDLNINPNNNCIIDLNNQSIYATGTIYFAPKCTLVGSGSIVADGKVTYQPSTISGSSDFILVMSVSNDVDFKPNGDFYGAVVGGGVVTTVELFPGSRLINPHYSGGLEFPIGDPVVKINKYDIE